MIRIAVCDSEVCYRNKISEILEKYFADKKNFYKMAVYDSGKRLIMQGEHIKRYNIVFMDINMEELDGIEIAQKIRSYTQDIFIVFVTADIKHSLEGYKVNAIRYILKNNNMEIAIKESLDTIMSKMNDVKAKQTFQFKEGKREVLLDNIIYIESCLHKLIFYIRKEEKEEIKVYSLYEKLDTIEEKINFTGFCRIHKSYLVNLKYVDDLQRYKAILNTGKELNIAKSRYKEVKEIYLLF